MPSHLHLIFRDQGNHPELLLGRFKSYTSRRLQKEISLNPSESKKAWMTRMFKKAASINSNVKNGMLWQHNNMPIELWTQDVIKRKVHYIHNNPVVAGFVIEPQHWKYSSAFDYAGGKGLINVRLLW
jgi:REP element-mobilizing transposase RayT